MGKDQDVSEPFHLLGKLNNQRNSMMADMGAAVVYKIIKRGEENMTPEPKNLITTDKTQMHVLRPWKKVMVTFLITMKVAKN